MWSTIQIVLGVLAILLALGADKLSMPMLWNASIVCFGLTSIAIGWEAILTQHMVLGRRRSGNQETYTGVPAIFQGVQFNLLGLFLMGIPVLTHFNNGRQLFLHYVQRPGLPLVIFGMLCLMQAVITLIGSHELKLGPRWVVIMNLLISRLLPGIILVVLGLGATGFGLFESIAPEAFDEVGGVYLEVLYGLQ